MRQSRASIFNLSKDPALVSQECLGTCPRKQLGNLTSTVTTSTNPYVGNDVYMNRHKNTSVHNNVVRRKATSYLMAAKGLLTKVNDKVDRIDHFIRLTQNSNFKVVQTKRGTPFFQNCHTPQI